MIDKDKVFLSSTQESLTLFSEQLNAFVKSFLEIWWDSQKPNPSDDDLEIMTTLFKTKFNNVPLEYKAVYESLEKLLTAMRFNSKNYINIHPLPLLPPQIASLIVSIQNPNNIVPEVSKATSQFENECIDFFTDLIGYKKDIEPWGNIVSGGTIANMTALLVARDYTYDKLDRPRESQIGRKGVIGKTPGVVIATSSSHYSLKKCLWFLGIGSENLIEVPVAVDEYVLRKRDKDEKFLQGISDKNEYKGLISIALKKEKNDEELQKFYRGEHEPFKLQPLDSEIFMALYSCFNYNTPLIGVVYTLGTTETGTIERLDRESFGTIAFDILKKEDIYVHADAAIGGYALSVPAIKQMMKGIENCDSVTIDGHKFGFLSYPCGAIIYKHRGYKHQIYHEAPYLKHLAPTLEGSRTGASSAACWVANKTLGVEGYCQYIQHILDYTMKVKDAIESSKHFQVLHRVDLNTICFSIKKKGLFQNEINELNMRLAQKINENNKFIVNTTEDLAKIKVKNHPQKDDTLTDIKTIRIVVTNPLVDMHDAKKFCDEIEIAFSKVIKK